MGTYTTNYQLYMPTVGETGWGTLINGNFTTIDSTMKGLSNRITAVENEVNGALSCTSVTTSGKVTANGGLSTKALTATTGTFSGAVTAASFNGMAMHGHIFKTYTMAQVTSTLFQITIASNGARLCSVRNVPVTANTTYDLDLAHFDISYSSSKITGIDIHSSCTGSITTFTQGNGSTQPTLTISGSVNKTISSPFNNTTNTTLTNSELKNLLTGDVKIKSNVACTLSTVAIDIISSTTLYGYLV